MTAPEIRKPVNHLTLEDLAMASVWEFVVDDDGEGATTVQPREILGELDATQGQFIVRARFRLADRTFVDGYLMPRPYEDADLSRTQPVIVTPRGHVGFWWGRVEPLEHQVAESYRRLAKSAPGEVFPIYFLSMVPLRTGAVSGSIPGFVTLTDARKTKVLR
jgi:hypothetical protein